jgi:hypothetical protein
MFLNGLFPETLESSRVEKLFVKTQNERRVIGIENSADHQQRDCRGHLPHVHVVPVLRTPAGSARQGASVQQGNHRIDCTYFGIAVCLSGNACLAYHAFIPRRTRGRLHRWRFGRIGSFHS